jgi:hypothetical protein
MFTVPDAVSWLEAGSWLIVILGAGFLVSWLATDLGHVRRDPYISLLTVVTVALMGGYLLWAGAGVLDFLSHHVIEGVLGGIVVAVPVSRGITGLPAAVPEADRRSAWAMGWQGAVYGVAEGVLLSALPALVVFNAAQTAGWTDTWPATLATGALALVAGAGMITIHHFGYWDYRSKQVIPVVFGCSLLTLSFLLTGSILAPAIGHAAMHVAGLRHGVELPPHEHHAPPPRHATTV